MSYRLSGKFQNRSGPSSGRYSALAWVSKCKAILVRYDKNWKNFLGCLQLVCALFRRPGYPFRHVFFKCAYGGYVVNLRSSTGSPMVKW